MWMILERQQFKCSTSSISYAKVSHQIFQKPRQSVFIFFHHNSQTIENVWLFLSLPMATNNSPLNNRFRKYPTNPITIIQPAKNPRSTIRFFKNQDKVSLFSTFTTARLLETFAYFRPSHWQPITLLRITASKNTHLTLSLLYNQSRIHFYIHQNIYTSNQTGSQNHGMTSPQSLHELY